MGQQILMGIQRLNVRLNKIEKGMEQFGEFVSTFKRFMRMNQTSNRASNENRADEEDYAEFKQMKRIEDEIELEHFEANLNEEAYVRKLTKFWQQKFELNGKQDANAFFKVLIRQIIAPTALMAFSWKGVQRTTQNEVDTTQNKCFKTKFPNLVDFIDSVLLLADFAHKSEHVDQYFDSHLRSKKKELQRETQRSEKNVLPRKVASRSHKRQLNAGGKADDGELIDENFKEPKRTKNDESANAVDEFQGNDVTLQQ